jgi:hypothetical protein
MRETCAAPKLPKNTLVVPKCDRKLTFYVAIVNTEVVCAAITSKLINFAPYESNLIRTGDHSSTEP